VSPLFKRSAMSISSALAAWDDGIAEVLLQLGHSISGSDIAESDTTRHCLGLVP